MGHRAERIAVALARAPGAQLRGEVRRGLPGERRVAAPGTLAARPVAGGAGLDSALGIAVKVEVGGSTIFDRSGGFRRHRQLRVVTGEALACRPVHLLGYPAHLRMASLAAGEELHLPGEVTGIEPREARHQDAVALSAKAVTSDAGPLRTGIAAAQRDQLAGRLEAVFDRLRRGARGERNGKRKERSCA